MPHVAKPIPRPCPLCGSLIRQKYFKLCGRCRAKAKKQRKEEKKFAKEIMELLKSASIVE